jgi:hypothetical protein
VTSIPSSPRLLRCSIHSNMLSANIAELRSVQPQVLPFTDRGKVNQSCRSHKLGRAEFGLAAGAAGTSCKGQPDATNSTRQRLAPFWTSDRMLDSSALVPAGGRLAVLGVGLCAASGTRPITCIALWGKVRVRRNVQTGPSVNGTVACESFTFQSVCEYYFGYGVVFFCWRLCVCE